MAERAIAELGGERDLLVRGPKPPAASAPPAPCGATAPRCHLPAYAVGDKVATRKAYGQALAALGARPGRRRPRRRGQQLDLRRRCSRTPTRTGTSRCSSPSSNSSPPRSAAASVATRRSPRPSRRSSPAPTTSSGWPAISQASIRLVGSHAGVEIGADGPSQMALEDLAMMRAVHGSTVLYPSDATSAAALVRGDGRPGRHHLPAHHPRRLSRCSTPPTRASRSAGSKTVRPLRRRRRDPDRRRGHPARMPVRGRPAARRRHPRPRDRPVFGQADRRRHPRRGRRRHERTASSWSRTTIPRAGSAPPSSTP